MGINTYAGDINYPSVYRPDYRKGICATSIKRSTGIDFIADQA
jgi:hypothetical protein